MRYLKISAECQNAMHHLPRPMHGGIQSSAVAGMDKHCVDTGAQRGRIGRRLHSRVGRRAASDAKCQNGNQPNCRKNGW